MMCEFPTIDIEPIVGSQREFKPLMYVKVYSGDMDSNGQGDGEKYFSIMKEVT